MQQHGARDYHPDYTGWRVRCTLRFWRADGLLPRGYTGRIWDQAGMRMRLAFLYHRVAHATHGDYTELNFFAQDLYIARTGVTLGPGNRHKNEVWQDRPSPVLGAMHITALTNC